MGIYPPIEAASLGMADSLLLMVLALVVFGPRRLPQIGKQIGKLMYEFRKASNDFKFQMEEELRKAEEEDRRKRDEAERQKSLAETQKAAELAKSAAETALNAAAEIKAAQAAATETAASPVANSGIEDQSTDAGLQVKPPSTGEQVEAARPGSTPIEEANSEQLDAVSNESAADSIAKIEPASEERTETEPTAHHG